MIARRTFLMAGCVIACAMAQPGRSEQRPKRIGVLLEGPRELLPRDQAFIDALRERGWTEGENLAFEPRFAKRNDDLPALAEELVRLKVDLILVFSTPGAAAAKSATDTIPILFDVGADPVERGLVKSMARPGGNLTGFVGGLFDEKLLEVFKQFRPRLARAMYPLDPPPAAAVRIAKTLGVEPIGFAVNNAGDFDAFFQAVGTARPDGVVVPNVGWMFPHCARIATALIALRMPSIGVWEMFSRAGGMLSYGMVVEPTRRVAKIDALLRGANPAEMPVERPTRVRLVVNLVTANKIGITLPNELLARADEVIRN